MNQVSLFLLAVVQVILSIARLMAAQGIVSAAVIVINSITLLAVYAVIVCVESRLDAYRIKREEAGWSEQNR